MNLFSDTTNLTEARPEISIVVAGVSAGIGANTTSIISLLNPAVRNSYGFFFTLVCERGNVYILTIDSSLNYL